MVDKKAIYNKAIAIYGKPYQTVVAMEELSELIKELSKDIRGKSKKNAIIEEIADVLIMIDQIKIIKDIADEEVENEILFKVTRLNNRLYEEQNGES